ncbi:alpha/beta hydrolase [Streptomyces sp. NPDC000229]|uniref:alpha/beta hydrolase n=1 Tax=Streptomyces sp. NPDC000229 TaxID=3154247 RepID=UPI00332E10E3
MSGLGERRADRDGDGHRCLWPRVVPPVPRGAVLLLHGGRSDALTPPPLLNLPAARMRPFGSAILRRMPKGDVLLATVRYRYRGWNGSRTDPVHDANEALDELSLLAPLSPVVLVGHSMGARAALRVAGHSQVSGVVALAPWCPPGEPVTHLRGKHLVVLHDEADRVTSARDSWDLVRRAHRTGARAGGISMPRGGHAMLRDAGDWHRLTASLTAGILGEIAMPPGLAVAEAHGTVCEGGRLLRDLPRGSR